MPDEKPAWIARASETFTAAAAAGHVDRCKETHDAVLGLPQADAADLASRWSSGRVFS
jgi:hypothetical protein